MIQASVVVQWDRRSSGVETMRSQKRFRARRMSKARKKDWTMVVGPGKACPPSVWPLRVQMPE
jgi:hypothetical protein